MTLSSKNSLSKDGLKLTYHKHGDGQKPIVTFHGFGQDHTTFENLLNAYTDEFVFYHFELPFHGESYHIPEKEAVEPEIFLDLFSTFLDNHQINEFSLIAFSIGAKPAISILNVFNTKIREIYFISPEGISINPWYRIATGNNLSRWLFNRLMKNRFPLTSLFSLFSKTFKLNKANIRYIETLFQSASSRHQIVYTWLSLRKFGWNKSYFINSLEQNQIRIHLVIGKRDDIANTKYLKKLARESEHVNLIILDGNHFSILKTATAYFRNHIME